MKGKDALGLMITFVLVNMYDEKEALTHQVNFTFYVVCFSPSELQVNIKGKTKSLNKDTLGMLTNILLVHVMKRSPKVNFIFSIVCFSPSKLQVNRRADTI